MQVEMLDYLLNSCTPRCKQSTVYIAFLPEKFIDLNFLLKGTGGFLPMVKDPLTNKHTKLKLISKSNAMPHFL